VERRLVTSTVGTTGRAGKCLDSWPKKFEPFPIFSVLDWATVSLTWSWIWRLDHNQQVAVNAHVKQRTGSKSAAKPSHRLTIGAGIT
jgi:hypothetical protein